jgi:hypothetical protein
MKEGVMKTFTLAILVFTAFLALGSLPIAMAAPGSINVQGILTNTTGITPTDGFYQITFRIYDQDDGGNAIWSETINDVEVVGGQFCVLLGRTSPILDSVFKDDNRWLEIQLEGDPPMRPRNRLTSVAYSFRSIHSDTAKYAFSSGNQAAGWRYFDSKVLLSDNGDSVGIGTDSLSFKLHIAGGSGALGVSSSYLGLDDPISQIEFNISDAGIDNSLRFNTKRYPGGLRYMKFIEAVASGERKFSVNGSGSIYAQGNLVVDGFTIRLNGPDLVISEESRGSGGRALVHGLGNELIINYASDFSGGTHVMGSGLKVDGITSTKVLRITGGADLAEPFNMSGSNNILPGAAVVIDDKRPGNLAMSSKAYDRRVAGIVSGAGGVKPGIVLVQEGKLDQGQNIALSGRVYAMATNCNGVIKPGDLLTTSDIPGRLMKATDSSLWSGAIVGKAMSGLDESSGLVLCLVNLQ